MKKIDLKTKLIIAAIVVVLVLISLWIVSAMSYGGLLLAVASFAVGGVCGWYAKYIYDKYFKNTSKNKLC